MMTVCMCVPNEGVRFRILKSALTQDHQAMLVVCEPLHYGHVGRRTRGQMMIRFLVLDVQRLALARDDRETTYDDENPL